MGPPLAEALVTPGAYDLTDRVLVLFPEVYPIDQYDRKALPCDIYTQDRVIRAKKGQAVAKDRLANSWVWVEKTWLRRDGQSGPAETSPAKESGGGQSAETPLGGSPALIRQPSKGPLAPQQREDYQEESAEAIEKRADEVPFEPFPVVKAGFKKNVGQFKEVFKKNYLGSSVVVSSKANKAISENVVTFLDGLLEHPFQAADYIELVNNTRNPSNHNTFAHSSGTVFYALAIAKKLKMLKDDFRDKKNVGRWLPVKTARNQRSGGAVPFSFQLAKAFDAQKAGIQVKYQEKERVILFEQMHDLMHQYAALDMAKDWPSMRVDYNTPNRVLIGMAALNADIGKLMIPNEVLHKSGDLDLTEVGFVQSHPLLGIFLMKEVANDNPRLLAYVLGHHRLLPTGYPPLKSNIFFESRIIGMADMYDGMRSNGFHKQAMGHEEALGALAKMYEAGAFDTPLWVAGQHVFSEFNHAYIARRNRQSVEPTSN